MDVAGRRVDVGIRIGISIDGMPRGTDVAGGVDGDIVGGDQAVAIAVGDVLTGGQHDITGGGAGIDGTDLEVTRSDGDGDRVGIVVGGAGYVGGDGVTIGRDGDRAVDGVDVEQLDAVRLVEVNDAGAGDADVQLVGGGLNVAGGTNAVLGSQGDEAADDRRAVRAVADAASGRLESHIAGAGSDGGHRQGTVRGGDADRVVRCGHAGQNDIAGG